MLDNDSLLPFAFRGTLAVMIAGVSAELQDCAADQQGDFRRTL